MVNIIIRGENDKNITLILSYIDRSRFYENLNGNTKEDISINHVTI